MRSEAGPFGERKLANSPLDNKLKPLSNDHDAFPL